MKIISVLRGLVSVWVLVSAGLVSAAPMVVLIGLDGFRADYLARGHAPVLAEMATRGALSEGLIPVFPSLTFPNHVTLVTGRLSQHHGIVNNVMSDPQLPTQTFRLSDRAAVSNPFWWSESLPIWVTAEQRGIKTATLFWPGSEAPIQGVQPSRWLPYQHELNPQQRVDLLLSWLREDKERPPGLATLYFSQVDSAGHAGGPDGSKVNGSITEVDQAIGRFREGLQALGLLQNTVFVVVADHGMTLVPPQQVIYGPGLLRDHPGARWEWTGATSGVSLGGEPEDKVLRALAVQKELTCWPKRDIPKRFGGGQHRRIPDVVCLAARGWSVTDRSVSFPIPGQHGFDPADPEMHGILLIEGKGISPRRLPRVQNVEVYGLMCRLLGITPAPHDGKGVLVRLLGQDLERSQ
jgi:ectonucleotide pyrophosphatase/phosphodiesterase family protein 5